jgi:hypothetical protein
MLPPAVRSDYRSTLGICRGTDPSFAGKFGRGLLRACRIDQPADGRDSVGGKASAAGMLLDSGFIRREVHAIHLVACDVTMEPLNPRAHFFQHADGFLGEFPPLGIA